MHFAKTEPLDLTPKYLFAIQDQGAAIVYTYQPEPLLYPEDSEEQVFSIPR